MYGTRRITSISIKPSIALKGLATNEREGSLFLGLSLF